MALRFRKSIKLAAGIRWNLSGSGSSWTFGPRGASIGVGQHGAFLNTGIPGTGLYSRSRLSGPSDAEPRRASTGSSSVSMTCAIRDDGKLYFVDTDGAAVPDHLVEVAKKQNRESILDLIQRKCEEINSQIEALGRLHLDTPDPKIRPQFTAPSFDEPAPTMPAPQVPGLLDKLFRSRGQRIADSNAAAELRHNEAMAQWNGRRVEFDLQVAKRRLLVESLIYDDIGAMESFLEERLHEIVWPRETVVAITIDDAGARVMLDVDPAGDRGHADEACRGVGARPEGGGKGTRADEGAASVRQACARHPVSPRRRGVRRAAEGADGGRFRVLATARPRHGPTAR